MANNSPLRFYFDQCELNAILSALNEIAECKVDCDWTTNAAALNETICKFAKIVPAKGAKYTDTKIAVTLYEKEVAILLKTLSLYITCIAPPQRDYTEKITRRK